MVFHTYADIQSGIMVVCHGAFRDRAVILLASRGPPGRAAIMSTAKRRNISWSALVLALRSEVRQDRPCSCDVAMVETKSSYSHNQVFVQ